MSDTGNIPAAMVEAAARAIPRIPSVCPDPQCGDSTWDHECELGGERLDYGTARAVLAAAFAECEVTEEVLWSAIASSPQSWLTPRRLAEHRVGYGTIHARRLVVVTPAQEETANG